MDLMSQMTITDAKYIKHAGENNAISCVFDGLPMSVPLDENNSHYAEIQRRVKSGDLTIAEAD